MIFGEHAKCQAEAEYPELWQGLVGAWSPCLSPRGGTVLRDLSGRGNHGTLTNMDPETDWVFSGGRSALDFDGTNDHVSLSNPSRLTAYTHGWLSLWLITRAPTASDSCYFSVVGNESSGQNLFIVEHANTSGALRLLARPNSGTTLDCNSGNGFIVGDVVQHWGVYMPPNGGAQFWKNGVQVATSYVTGNSSTVAWFSTIGTAVASYLCRMVTIATRYANCIVHDFVIGVGPPNFPLMYRLGPGGWATPRRRRWGYVTAQTAIPYWVFARKNARLIGGGVT